MGSSSADNIKKKIADLEQEIHMLKTQLKDEPTVKVPDALKPIFDQAAETVKEYFSDLKLNPEKGTIEINGQRYILVRAAALSNEFFENIAGTYTEKSEAESFQIASNFLFDMGHLIGMEDAKRFHEKMNLSDPISKLSAGPIHFAHSGWAFVEILKDSNPVADENYFIKYHHPYSFEADSWIRAGKKSDKPVCIMNAAYSSGWCSQSFGIPLTAVEISCKAKGDKNCTFIMAQPHKINDFLDQDKTVSMSKEKPNVPFFFERKAIEERLVQNEQMLNTAQRIAKLGSWEFHLKSQELFWSDELYRIFEIDPSEKNLLDAYYARFSDGDLQVLNARFSDCITMGLPYQLEHAIHLTDGRKKTIFCAGIPLFNSEQEVVKVFGVAQDISESIQQKEKLFNSLREKEVLLKEVHHRVKNNLQIISSLLNLQSSLIGDERIHELYRESQHRIKSIASIHEMLYQTNDLVKINFKDYIEKLIVDLVSSYHGNNNQLNFTIDCAAEFNLDTAIPLGLLINEIVSNSLKHGLSNTENDLIYVRIVESETPLFYELHIGDNGSGFNFKQAAAESETLGMMLISELSNQLDGTMEIADMLPGTHYFLKFKAVSNF